MKTNKETGEEKKVFSGYRLYTRIKLNAGFVTVGVEVKNMGMDLEVNSIQTVFTRRRKGDLEEEIYRDPEITHEQSAILDRRGHKNNTQVIVTSKRA